MEGTTKLVKGGFGAYLPLVLICTLSSAVLIGGTRTPYLNPIEAQISKTKFSLDSARSHSTSLLKRVEEKCKSYELIHRNDQ